MATINTLKEFQGSLKRLSGSVRNFREAGQEVALFCIRQAIDHGNVDPCINLIFELTEADGHNTIKTKDGLKQKHRYTTSDAQRLTSFIVEFCYVKFQPQLQHAKQDTDRMKDDEAEGKKIVWLGEDTYPKWFEHVNVPTPEVVEQDGVSVLTKTLTQLAKRVESGKLKISEKTRPIFDSVLNGAKVILEHEVNKTKTPAKAEEPALM